MEGGVGGLLKQSVSLLPCGCFYLPAVSSFLFFLFTSWSASNPPKWWLLLVIILCSFSLSFCSVNFTVEPLYAPIMVHYRVHSGYLSLCVRSSLMRRRKPLLGSFNCPYEFHTRGAWKVKAVLIVRRQRQPSLGLTVGGLYLYYITY